MFRYVYFFWFETPKKRELVNITTKVADAVLKWGIQEGVMLVSAMHITDVVIVNV